MHAGVVEYSSLVLQSGASKERKRVDIQHITIANVCSTLEERNSFCQSAAGLSILCLTVYFRNVIIEGKQRLSIEYSLGLLLTELTNLYW